MIKNLPFFLLALFIHITTFSNGNIKFWDDGKKNKPYSQLYTHQLSAGISSGYITPIYSVEYSILKNLISPQYYKKAINKGLSLEYSNYNNQTSLFTIRHFQHLKGIKRFPVYIGIAPTLEVTNSIKNTYIKPEFGFTYNPLIRFSFTTYYSYNIPLSSIQESDQLAPHLINFKLRYQF